MAVVLVTQSLQVDPENRLVAWGLATLALLAGVATACLFRVYASWRGLTTTPEPSTYYWAVLAGVASVPVWEQYVTPLASLLLVGWIGSFFVTTVWLYRERGS
jgi:hypothetical protein